MVRVSPAGNEAAAPELHARGSTVGRYIILGLLGRGGMGVVYSAHDPELERTVALKLLRAERFAGGSAGAARARLVREARAAARITHPNVVAVHDAGTHEGEVFVAMELVAGPSLREWLRSPRPRRQVLGVMIQAGRGLAASHAAGMIHRDFKPANVLVGHDGRVRVSDFGLVQLADDAEPEQAPCDDDDCGLASVSRLTTTGTVVGTPAYMAPEQRAGAAIDARTDQWSFAFTLKEALQGGRDRAPPAAGAIPVWLRRILQRALSPDPARRYPSMEALLVELERDRRRRWPTIAVALAIAAAAVLGQRRTPPACEGLERPLAGVWDGPRKAAIRAAFTATGEPFAAAAWAGVSARVDAYAGRWAAMRRDACEATRVRGEQSEEILELRMVCLDERWRELGALAALYRHADGEVVANAAAAAQALTSLDGCADLRALTTRVRSPSDPLTRSRLATVRALLGAARALDHAGRYPAARDVALVAAAEARTLRDRAGEGAALLVAGEQQLRLGASLEARDNLEAAVRAADAGRDDATAAMAWTALVKATGVGLRRTDEATRQAGFAAAAIERLGGDARLEAALMESRATLLRASGQLAAALAEEQRVLAFESSRLPPDDVRSAVTLTTLGLMHADLAQLDEALAAHQRALALCERALGPDHPRVGLVLQNLGNALRELGRFDEAEPALRRSLGILERGVGRDEHQTANAASSLADVLREQHRMAEALELLRRAVAIDERLFGPDSRAVALQLLSLGAALHELGDLPEAGAAFDRARAIFETARDELGLGAALFNLAGVRRDEGRHAEALAALARVLSLRTRRFGPDHPSVAQVHGQLGSVYLAQRRFADAERSERLAIAITEKGLGPEASTLSNFLAELGEALAARGRHAEALAVQRRALALDEEVLPATHPDLGDELLAVAGSLVALGRRAEAVPLLERAGRIVVAGRRGKVAALLARARSGL